jgi:hypothetical protein
MYKGKAVIQDGFFYGQRRIASVATFNTILQQPASRGATYINQSAKCLGSFQLCLCKAPTAKRSTRNNLRLNERK